MLFLQCSLQCSSPRVQCACCRNRNLQQRLFFQSSSFSCGYCWITLSLTQRNASCHILCDGITRLWDSQAGVGGSGEGGGSKWIAHNKHVQIAATNAKPLAGTDYQGSKLMCIKQWQPHVYALLVLIRSAGDVRGWAQTGTDRCVCNCHEIRSDPE